MQESYPFDELVPVVVEAAASLVAAEDLFGQRAARLFVR
jgi:hypothetical protein